MLLGLLSAVVSPPESSDERVGMGSVHLRLFAIIVIFKVQQISFSDFKPAVNRHSMSKCQTKMLM